MGNQANLIIDQNKYNEIRDKGSLNGKPIRGFAEFNAIYFFCYDLDLLGSHYGNMGLIEYADYYQAIKIDPSIFIKIECFFDFPSISYEQVLSYFFNFEYFHDLFKNVSPADNILAFQKIINISESQIYEIVFNPAFTSVEAKGELYIAPISCFIKEDTLQKQMWVSLQQRKNLFNLVYTHFFPLYQAISKNAALDHCLELLLEASQQSGLPVLKAAVYSGDLKLIAHCIENYPNEFVFHEEQNLLHLACELEFTELVEFLYKEKQDLFKSLNTGFPKTEVLGETFFYMLHLHSPEELELLKKRNLSKEQKKAVECYDPCSPFTITPRKPLKLPYLKGHEFDASWINIVHQAMERAVFEAEGMLGENGIKKKESLIRLSAEFKIKNWQSTNEEIRMLLMDFWTILAAPTSIRFFRSERGDTLPALVFKKYINENGPAALINYIRELTDFSLEVQKDNTPSLNL